MKTETTEHDFKIIPGNLSLGDETRQNLRRGADPQDLNDALLAVHMETAAAELSEKIYSEIICVSSVKICG